MRKVLIEAKFEPVDGWTSGPVDRGFLSVMSEDCFQRKGGLRATGATVGDSCARCYKPFRPE